MNYYEALDLLDQDRSNELLEKCKMYLDDLEHCRKEIFENVFHDPNICSEMLNKLSGIKMYLEPIYLACDTYKKFKQGQTYYIGKTDFAKNKVKDSKEKFNSSAMVLEASHKVADLRRLRNGIEASINQCVTGISSCQSTLKHLNERA